MGFARDGKVVGVSPHRERRVVHERAPKSVAVPHFAPHCRLTALAPLTALARYVCSFLLPDFALTIRNQLVTYSDVDAVVQALADPIRREILLMLAKSPMNAGEIAATFSVSRPAVSRHLRVLREAGWVSDESSGRERTYTLQLEASAVIEAYLNQLRAACRWERRLAALETEVHRVKRKRRRQARDRDHHDRHHHHHQQQTKKQKETA